PAVRIRPVPGADRPHADRHSCRRRSSPDRRLATPAASAIRPGAQRPPRVHPFRRDLCPRQRRRARARPGRKRRRHRRAVELLPRAATRGGGQDFFLIRADGTLIRSFGLPSQLRFGSDWDNSGPAWSPDGTRLAYNRVEPLDGDPAGHFRVHVIRADGTGDVTLPGPSEPLVHEAWPVWSPDGRWIAVEHFVFGDPGQDWLAMLPSDGSAPARDLLPRRFASPG